MDKALVFGHALGHAVNERLRVRVPSGVSFALLPPQRVPSGVLVHFLSSYHPPIPSTTSPSSSSTHAPTRAGWWRCCARCGASWPMGVAGPARIVAGWHRAAAGGARRHRRIADQVIGSHWQAHHACCRAAGGGPLGRGAAAVAAARGHRNRIFLLPLSILRSWPNG